MPKMYIGSRQVSQAVNLARQVDDRNLVHLTDDETISGVKTFTDNVVISTDTIEKDYQYHNSTLDLTDTEREHDIWSFYRAFDKNGNIAGDVGFAYRTDGSSITLLQARNYTTGEQLRTSLFVTVTADGDRHVSTNVHPKEDSDGYNVATTGWVNDRTNIRTNCITEIPQDIKLELNNGTLTLKSGSKVYIPNGFEQDGVTRKFDVLTIETDVDRIEDTSSQYMCFYQPSNNIIYIGATTGIFATTTVPTNLGQYTYWYDLTNNIIKRSDDYGATWTTGYSLPIGLITVSNGNISLIDQKFNGLGFMGNRLFVLPGLKGLMPDGRDEDGTIKNRIIKYTAVALRDTGYGPNNAGGKGTATTQNPNQQPGIAWEGGPYGYVYDFENNYYYTTDPGESSFNAAKRLKLAEFTHDGTRLTSITPNYVFQAVDYNDFRNYKNEVNDSIANISTTLDSTVVHLTGNETITGSKTFTSNLINKMSSASLFDNSPTSKYYYFFDTNNRTTGWLENRINGNSSTGNPGQSTIKIFAKTFTDNTYSTDVTNSIELHVFPDGTGYATCPTPPANDNSTKIATTAWVNSAKTTIVGWGVPDKSRAISVAKKSSGSSYTAQVTGWVQIIGGSGGNRLATLDCYNSTNGYGDTDHVGEYADQYGTIRCMLLVSAGDTYTVTYWNASLTSITEIPLKGA